MLGVVADGDGLGDQEDGYAVLDAVRTPQTRVVEELAGSMAVARALGGHQQERPAVLRAHEQIAEALIEQCVRQAGR